MLFAPFQIVLEVHTSIYILVYLRNIRINFYEKYLSFNIFYFRNVLGTEFYFNNERLTHRRHVVRVFFFLFELFICFAVIICKNNQLHSWILFNILKEYHLKFILMSEMALSSPYK